MSGIENQKTGDYAETLFCAALGRDFVSGRFVPDLGEDFWIEYRGREAAHDGSTPLRALIQVRGAHRQGGRELARSIETKHIHRWAAQPLPVFVVGVAEKEPRQTFYLKSIDDILRDDLKDRDPMRLDQEFVQVQLPLVQDVPGRLRIEIMQHYKGADLDLEGLDENTVEQQHFEVLRKRGPEQGELVPLASWVIYWKSPQRPQHLLAVLREAARRAHLEYVHARPRPAYVIFHFYRSLMDVERNLAAARVDWVDPTHPKATDIARVMGFRGSFNVRQDDGVDERREALRSLSAKPQEYLIHARTVGPAFDSLTDRLLADPSPGVWDQAMREEFEQIDTLWEKGPFAPTECIGLERILSRHHAAISDHFFVSVYRREKLSSDVVRRLLDDTKSQLQDCRGAWRLLLSS